MKTKNKKIIMLFLVFIGITLCYSQGWADDNLELKKTIFCKNQGKDADETVGVEIKYVGKQVGDGKFTWEPVEWKPVEKNVLDESLKVAEVKQYYIYLEEENPANPDDPQVRVGPILYTGSPDGIICTNSLPCFVVKGQIFCIERKE
jgi:hypothetical protein